MSHALSLTPAEEKIAGRIDQNASRELAVSDAAGGLAFANVSQVMEFAKMMAVASIAVPKHLRANPGACMAVCIQAIEWRMSPYAVANKSYSVNDRLAYEAQLVQAVILQRAPIKGRIKVEYQGTGDKRVCRVWAELKDEPGEIVEYTSPEFGKITPKNSPLWKSDPDQQQFYYSVRAMCRRHFPDVLLGVYAKDEIEDTQQHIGPDRAKDVTPKTLTGKLDALATATPRSALETAPADPQAIAGEESQLPATELEDILDVPPAQAADDEDGSEAETMTHRDVVLDRARDAAMQGSKRLKFFLGKLSADDRGLLTDDDIASLEAAATRIEG